MSQLRRSSHGFEADSMVKWYVVFGVCVLISGIIQQTTFRRLEERYGRVAYEQANLERVETFGIEGVVFCKILQDLERIMMKRGGRHHAQVLATLLVIGGVEQNPGPTGFMQKGLMMRRGITQWNHWNLDSSFQYARVGKDSSYEARVERLLSLCEPNSIAANQLCEQHETLMEEWKSHKNNYQTQKKIAEAQDLQEIRQAEELLVQAANRVNQLVSQYQEASDNEKAAIAIQRQEAVNIYQYGKSQLKATREIAQARMLTREVGVEVSSDEEVWNRLKLRISVRCMSQSKETELDRLKKIRKRGKERWTDYVTRFKQTAEKVAPSMASQYSRVLIEQLPNNLKMHVITLPQDTGIGEVVKRIERVLYWSDTDTIRGGSSTEPMDIGMMEETEGESDYEDEECQAAEERRYKPIFNGRKINFENISGPKTLMVAWKRLVSQSNNFKKESESYLKNARARNEGAAASLFQMEEEEGEMDEENEVAEFCGVGELYECETIKNKDKNSMHVTALVNGEKVKALIDTGATQSFIQESLVQKMKLTDRIQQTEAKVKLADGNIQKLKGKIIADVKVGEQQEQTELFMLHGKGPAMILGYPYIKNQRWMIDCMRKTLTSKAGEEIQCNVGEMARSEEVVFERMNKNFEMPSKKHADDAGIDFVAPKDIYLKPGTVTVVSTECKAKIPEGKWLLLKERSTLASKMNVTAMAGIVDGGYRGEIKAVLFNASKRIVKIKKGVKFVQAIIMQNYPCQIREGKVLSDTARGEAGGVNRVGNGV